MLGHLTEEEIISVLKRNALGRIGCTDGKHTYIVPINYYYDDTGLIMHSHVGKKIEMMRTNPQVCFEVDELQDFTNWKSVIVWGRYEEVESQEEQSKIIASFVNSLMRIKPSETALLPELSATRLHPRSGPLKTIIFRIVIETMTGRFETDRE
ncbi:MAG TPA: pyridoxamine 5'-phosphate oxidase family protein [Chitinophagaceae bacterium]